MEGQWEDLCEKCGLCCFEKLEDEKGRILFLDTACRYLDITTRECKIYDRRFEINPECIQLTEELVHKLHWLHDECGYRRAYGLTRKKKKKAPGGSPA